MLRIFFDVSAIMTSNCPPLSAIFVGLGVFEALIGETKDRLSLVNEIEMGAPCSTATVDRIIAPVQGPVADLAAYQPSSSAKANVVDCKIMTAERTKIFFEISHTKKTP